MGVNRIIYSLQLYKIVCVDDGEGDFKQVFRALIKFEHAFKQIKSTPSVSGSDQEGF